MQFGGTQELIKKPNGLSDSWKGFLCEGMLKQMC